MTPGDLATIYNFHPLFDAGVTGRGQTIYLIEGSDLYDDNDWTTFRTLIIPQNNAGTLSTIHPAPPSGINNCSDPGAVIGSEGETTIDAEWSGAAAPDAAIVVASCANTRSSFGVMIALENVVNESPPPAIISISFGACEPNSGAAQNAAINSAYQLGVAEGASIFVSSGDGDAAGCDNFDTAIAATHGIAVNAWASTPYNVATGGTDFGDTYFGINSTYWSSVNSVGGSSALSYIPEIAWNAACGSQLLASYLGYSATYGTAGLCNHRSRPGIAGGSGGPSGCAAGSPSTPGVVSGSCQGYPKPSWQSGLIGNPADGVRDLPDVSMFASNSVWTHGYVACFSAPTIGKPCTGPPSTWQDGGGGTSYAAPIWAGIQALINQRAGGPQGLPNYRLYQLAAKEYGTGGNGACNSSNGNNVAGSCIFYDVTLGDNDAGCEAGSPNCYAPSGTYGVLSTSTTFYAPAFQATVGWDFATGIGTVNVANLVNGWIGGGVPLTDAHDFNGDRHSDLLWRDAGGDTVIWLLNGGQVLQSGSLGTVPTVWSIVGQRDFNGDGDADILWRDNSGNLSMWLMNGLTVSSGVGLGNVPTTWTVSGTGDLNGDGKGDILWRDSAGDVAIWFMNGSAVVSTASLGNVPTNWTIIGDDNNGDIFWHDNSGNYVVWQLRGWQVVTTSLGNVPLATWQIVGLGDFNGDGTTDILWRDTAGDVAIWLLNSTLGVQSTASLGNVSPTTWAIAQTGDYNGDGMSDILWLDNSGNTAVWFMNGSQVASFAGYGSVGTAWSLQSLNAE